MKILYVVPDGEDLGGILTSTENLLCGFREAGHVADFALLRDTKNTGTISVRSTMQKGLGSGRGMSTSHGWSGEYFSWAALDQYIAHANKYDIVVWGAGFGIRNKINEGKTNWLRAFSDVKAKQVMMIRDDHLPDRYPWIGVIEPWLAGWACVQRSSYTSCAGLRKPRAIIYSGHKVDELLKPMHLKQRDHSIFAMSTFKSWKRMDRVVAAVPHLPTQLKVIVAGDGIEGRYMRSKDKCKPRYMLPSGEHIWDVALTHGMDYRGSITELERDVILNRTQFFIDTSYRKHSTGQINRVIVEAIKCGCVPLAVNQFITGNAEGNGELFKAGEHYLPIDPDCSPQGLAAQIAEYSQRMRAKPVLYNELQAKGRELIGQFCRKKAAQNLVLLAQGKKCGADYDKGLALPNTIAHGEKSFNEIFGKLP